MKKDKLSTHKKKAWNTFSIYIRTRDCIKTTGNPNEAICVTCPSLVEFKKLHAGHWIGGRNNAVLFSEKGVHGQCFACNVGLHGNPIVYWVYMENHYGRKVMDQLIAESHQAIKYKAWDYDNIAEEYKEKTKQLLAHL